MLTRIEALNYRSLRFVSQALKPFQVLIGPNASGKSTFLDIIVFIADLARGNTLANIVYDRSRNILDLTWNGQTDWFELAVTAQIPDEVRPADTHFASVRYEVRIGIMPQSNELGVIVETLWLLEDTSTQPAETSMQPTIFPVAPEPPDRITSEARERAVRGRRKVVSKTATGNDYFQSETTNWNNSFRLGPRKSSLANLPEDDTRFPISTWFKRYITEGVQRLSLNSAALRVPSPPQSPRTFVPDGSNLPWVIRALETDNQQRWQQWIDHVRTAVPDIQTITTVERPEDRHRYLVVEYATGLQAPSWMVSDGTLRMLALTILAYLPDTEAIYLVEEPENGIHPRAVEPVLQSLSSVYGSQVLLATHSPVILNLAKPDELLCFARGEDGATAVVWGTDHPRLQAWKGEISLGVLYAGGVLG